MSDGVDSEILLMVFTGIIVIFFMSLFGVRFILYYHRRRREALMEKQLMSEVFQRELLQAQVETQNQTLQQIAEELHDNIGQLLTVIVLRLNSMEEKCRDPSVNIEKAVQQTLNLVQKVVVDVRALTKTLDYNTLEQFGLLSSLTFELERVQLLGQVDTHFSTSGEPYFLGEQVEIVLLRMAQESINNTLKHANARNLTISTEYGPDEFILTITDDGTGFQMDELASRTLKKSGSGLNNLKRRASLLGGSCIIDSRLGEGTRIQIRIAANQST